MATEEELQQRINELEGKLENVSEILSDQINQVNRLQDKLGTHSHTTESGTAKLEKSIDLEQGQQYSVGQAGVSSVTQDLGAATETQRMFLVTGPTQGPGTVASSDNAQITLEHTLGSLSFFYGFRDPLYEEVGVVVNSNSSTIETNRFSWEENELAGAHLILYDENVSFRETRDVVGNTEDEITMDTSPSFDTADGTFVILDMIYLGSAEFPWKRAYVDDGAAGGVRFGVGPTAQGQNGLLYMRESDGHLIWRNPDGTEEDLQFD